MFGIPFVGETLLASGGNLIGGERANRSNERIAREDRAFQAGESSLSRDFQAGESFLSREFQERMSSTAYQRATDDMRKAGLNPLLAFERGGASTPPGASGHGASASGSRAEVRDSLSPAIATALQMKRLDGEIDVMKSQEYKNLREGALANALKIKASEDSVNSALTAEHMRLQLPKAKNLADAENKIGSDVAPIDRILQTIGLGSRAFSGVLR